jgi:hypothetical protein
MKARAAASQYKFSSFVETIVSSPQFLYKKEQEIHEPESAQSGR